MALKVIHASNTQQERFFKRFERETRAMAVLTHPGVVQIYDVGDFDGLPNLAMEYLPGGTIKRYLGCPMAWQEAVSMLLPVSNTLSFAHKQGNILLGCMEIVVVPAGNYMYVLLIEENMIQMIMLIV